MLTYLPQPYQRQPPKEQQRARLIAAIRSLGVTMQQKPITIASVVAQVKKQWEKAI